MNGADLQVTPELTGKVSTVEQWAGTLTVRDPQEYAGALEQVKRIKTIRANVVDFFRESKDAANRAWKAIVANEKTFTDRLDNAERIAKAKLIAFQQAEEEKRQAEQRRLQAEADERARKERERLEAQAAKAAASGKAEKAEALQAKAAEVQAPAVVVESRIEANGQSVRKTWKAKLVSMEALTGIPSGDIRLTFLEFSESAANKFAQATKGAVRVPGIEYYEESTLAVLRG